MGVFFFCKDGVAAGRLEIVDAKEIKAAYIKCEFICSGSFYYFENVYCTSDCEYRATNKNLIIHNLWIKKIIC